MGHAAVTRMAREDTRWFVIAVIVLALVLFLALPLAVLHAVDTEKRLSKAEARIDRKIKKLERLELEIKKEKQE